MLWGGAATTSAPASSSTVSARQPFNYGVAADMSMVGLRDVLFVAPAAAGGGDQPIIPLLSTSPYHVEDHSRNAAAAAAIHLWQQQQQPSSFNLNPNPNLRKPMAMPLATMLDSAGGLGANISLPTSSTSTATCQDCGNQAKKDCTHRRCRTCCKGRGFDCSTHVKSTWVPAARRRETQLTTGAAVGSSGSTSASKKPRLTAATSNTSNSNTPPRSFDTSSSHQEESLPGQVRAPAVFKCVKVTSVDDGDGEYAYQAMVRIGGHVFKGFLYDQGLKERHHNGDEGNKNSNNAIPNLSELHLGGGGGYGVGGASDVYAGGTTGTLMGGGTAYGNYMN